MAEVGEKFNEATRVEIKAGDDDISSYVGAYFSKLPTVEGSSALNKRPALLDMKGVRNRCDTGRLRRQRMSLPPVVDIVIEAFEDQS